MDNCRDEKTANVCGPGCWCSRVRRDNGKKNVSFDGADAVAPPSACPSEARKPQPTNTRYCCRSAKNEIENEAPKTADRPKPPTDRCEQSSWTCEFLKRQPVPEWTVKVAARCADRRTAKIRSNPSAPTTAAELSAAAGGGGRCGGFGQRVSDESICGFLKRQPTPEWIVRDRQSGTDCHASGAREPPVRRYKNVADNTTAAHRNPGADCCKPSPPPPPLSCGCGSRRQRQLQRDNGRAHR